MLIAPASAEKMMRFAVVFLSTLLFAADASAAATKSGCGKELPAHQSPGAVRNVSITSNGIPRSYLVFVPPTYSISKPTQLILSFHGGTKTAEDQRELDGLTSPQFNTDYFVVYPQGIDNRWQSVPGTTANDVLFTADLLDHVQAKYCLDASRIMVAGKSDGGGMCNLLACDADLSQRIAAFAPVSGAYYVDDVPLPCDPDAVAFDACKPGRTDIPLLAFHGGRDKVIAYGGNSTRKGACLPSIPHWVRAWAAREHLGRHNDTTPVGTDAVQYHFGGANNSLVNLVYDPTNGHDWPSTVPNADNQHAGQHPTSYNATPMILDFFAQHSMTGLS